jgi:hypothetical protein
LAHAGAGIFTRREKRVWMEAAGSCMLLFTDMCPHQQGGVMMKHTGIKRAGPLAIALWSLLGLAVFAAADQGGGTTAKTGATMGGMNPAKRDKVVVDSAGRDPERATTRDSMMRPPRPRDTLPDPLPDTLSVPGTPGSPTGRGAPEPR